MMSCTQPRERAQRGLEHRLWIAIFSELLYRIQCCPWQNCEAAWNLFKLLLTVSFLSALGPLYHVPIYFPGNWRGYLYLNSHFSSIFTTIFKSWYHFALRVNYASVLPNNIVSNLFLLVWALDSFPGLLSALRVHSPLGGWGGACWKDPPLQIVIGVEV